MVLSKGTGAYWFVINQTAGFTVSRCVQRVMSAVEWIARRRPAVDNYRHVAAVAMVTTPFSTKRWLVKRPVTCRYYKGFNTSSTLWNVRDSILTIPLCTLVRQIRAVRRLQTREACRVCQLCFCIPWNHRRAVRLVPCFLQKGFHYIGEIFVWNLVAVGCLKNRFPSYLGYPLYIIRSGIRYQNRSTLRDIRKESVKRQE